MQKVTVELCMGTTCFVMGSSGLPDFMEMLTPEQRSCIELKHSPCMGFCKDQKYGKAPYVRINDELLASASSLKVAEKIRALLKA